MTLSSMLVSTSDNFHKLEVNCSSLVLMLFGYWLLGTLGLVVVDVITF